MIYPLGSVKFRFIISNLTTTLIKTLIISNLAYFHEYTSQQYKFSALY